jgi:lipopolysaccharide biosynthesis glycosyltransferase
MMIRVVIGFDQRESVAYHTFCQSILEKASEPVSFAPLALNTLKNYSETHTDGSNSFIYSRFLTPWLYEFNGWAIFADGDMICRDDIAKLWKLRDESKAVMVVKHDYKTKAHDKYLGNKNENYPRKNWSSVILWNCAHPKHKILTPDFIMKQTGAFLHRFTWLDDADIGELPKEWNWLTTEYPDNYNASLLHYTLGTPCFKDYHNCEMADEWHGAYKRVQDGIGV